MRVLVLGAGLLGVTSAYYLQQLGHEVRVVDRQSHPAAETSFANGGQISVCHAEPWARPDAPLKILRWLGREDAPLLFRLRADRHQWLWGLRFLRECTPGRARRNLEQLLRLGSYSRTQLQALRAATDIEYEQRTQGILHFYTNPAVFDSALGPTALMQELGCARRLLTPREAVTIEPALRSIEPRLVGATYTPEDESGDAQRFVRQLAQHCEAAGVQFLPNHAVTALRAAQGRIDHVEATDAEGRYQRLQADAYVLALGSFSPALAAPLGLRLAIYPAKGYSVTLPLRDAARAFEVSMIDDEYKLVFSRLGDRLRIAGTAEFNGYSRALNPRRCQAIVQRFEQLFPGAGETAQAQFWSGLRPATPSNVPLIGRTHLPNLYLNTGHGTLGFTHACGSGLSIARIVSGLAPEVDFAFTGF
jgi:D-amino-acid dehydrogenase